MSASKRSPKRKELEGKLGTLALTKIKSALRNKSPEKTDKFGARIGMLFFRASKKHRERTLSNLELAFPDWTQDQRLEVAKDVFRHYGRIAADFMNLEYRDREDIISSVSCDSFDVVERIAAQGKGAILLTGHFGHWERLVAYLAQRGIQVVVVVRTADDEGVDRIINDARRQHGATVIARGNAARPLIDALRHNKFIGMLSDQNSDEIYLPFFGKPAGSVLGPGVLSERTRVPVIGAYCARTGVDEYRAVFEELPPEPGYETRGEGQMRAYYAWLERVIRLYPEQYLWFHDRWRNARRKGLL